MFVLVGFFVAIAVGLWILCSVESCRPQCSDRHRDMLELRLCFSLMDNHTLLQQFCYILSLASLAYIFTTLHTIQYYTMANSNRHSATTQPTPGGHQQFLILGPTLSRCGKLCSAVQHCIVSHSVKVRVPLFTALHSAHSVPWHCWCFPLLSLTTYQKFPY